MPAPSNAAPAPIAPAPQPTATVVGKTASQCNAEYAANKAAIRAGGQTKREFVAACRSGNETIPQGSAAAPAPAPAQTSGSLFRWQQPPAPAPAPAPTNYSALRPRAESRPHNRSSTAAPGRPSFG